MLSVMEVLHAPRTPDIELPAFSDQFEIQLLVRGVLEKGLEATMEHGPVGIGHEIRQRLAGQLMRLKAQHVREGLVCLENDSSLVDDQVPHRGVVEEFGKAVPGGFHLLLGFPQLLVLQFQFDLVDLIVVDQRLEVPRREVLDGFESPGQPRFGLPAQRFKPEFMVGGHAYSSLVKTAYL